ncbi:extracellular solute-binding protein [Paenibacillus koleovorans]|uniref:extracellular solute-binding protein n=1 Tax=Paenibacillus koleovorans TaxID=121608 RepID=UPI001FEC41FF|nr:extracellular solute-binding protein [Paenibacillus koleovorans]
MKKSVLVCLIMAVLCSGCDYAWFGRGLQEDAGGVTVYTARHYEADSALFEAFTKQTGIRVHEIKGTAEELIGKMAQDRENAVADLFFTVDGGVLSNAKQADVLQPLRSEIIDRQVPQQWRDPDQYWIGVTRRARVLVYSKDRVRREELSTYEELTDTKWKGRLLVRSSQSLYNQSLLASFISLNGKDRAMQWAKGVATNLSRAPEGGDREQALAILDGVGDVAIMNTYYFGQLANSTDPDEARVADQLAVFFPNQLTTGTHINISGIGLARYAPHKANAIKLVEYMTSREGQTLLVNKSYEFPVNEEATLPKLLESWGTFKAQELDFSELGAHQQAAIELFRLADWP